MLEGQTSIYSPKQIFRGWEGDTQVGPIPKVGDADDKYIWDDDEMMTMMIIRVWMFMTCHIFIQASIFILNWN
jgi:hypothetical protein